MLSQTAFELSWFYRNHFMYDRKRYSLYNSRGDLIPNNLKPSSITVDTDNKIPILSLSIS